MLFARPITRAVPPAARLFNRQAVRNLAIWKGYYIHPLDKHQSLVSFSRDPEHLSVGTFIHNNFESSELNNENAKDLVKLSETTFEANREFLNRLWAFLADNVQDDYSYQLEAGEFPGSHMPIYDFRKIPEYGRRSEVDDVFGWVRVASDSSIIKGTFEKNEMYRPFTKNAGLPQLTDYLKEHIEEITKP